MAGSGISGCGPALGLSANITDRTSIRAMLNEAVLAPGGLDAIAITAGIFVAPDTSGHIPDDKWAFDKWALTFAINVTGAYLVADTSWIRWSTSTPNGSKSPNKFRGGDLPDALRMDATRLATHRLPRHQPRRLRRRDARTQFVRVAPD